MIAWRHKKTGRWLVIDDRHTHTKLSTTYSFTDNINAASTGLPSFEIRKEVEPIEVKITRTVEIIEEKHMATSDVPGAKSVHNDVLAMGCWAEHEDGSLILVESTENGRIIFSVFDVATDPITEYRDSMPDSGFKQNFSWDPKKKDSLHWTWHDKTPFPWSRVIKDGAKDGLRHVHADDLLNAAQKVARSRKMRSQDFDPESIDHMQDIQRNKPARSIITRIQNAIDQLRG